MESEDKKPIFTKRTFVIIGIIILIIILFLIIKGCVGGKKDNPSAVTGITIEPLNLSVAVGETSQLYVTITPDGAANKKFTCTSSNNEVVSVDPNTCSIIGVGSGTATITAISDDGGFTSKSTVIVTDETIKLTGIKFNATTYTIKVGKTKLTSISALPKDAQLPDVTYTIADTSFATVNENGVLTGVKEGKTKLVAKTKDGKYQASAEVIVVNDEKPIECKENEVLVDGNCVLVPPKPKKINLIETSTTIKVGETYVIRATVEPSDAIGDIVCSTSDTNYITLNGCVITGKAVGTGTVKVCAKEDKNVCTTFTATIKKDQSTSTPTVPSDPIPEIIISTSGTDGWTTWGRNAWGYVQVRKIKSGYGVKISCVNASCGAINNTASSTTFQRGFLAEKNNATATIEVIVTNANGKVLASKTASFVPTKLDTTAPSCNYYISGSYVVANCTETGSGLGAASSDWTKSGSTYKKYLGTTAGTQSYNFTIKDNAGNQYSGSVKVKTESKVTCQSGYTNYPQYDTKYCLKYAGLTKWGDWVKETETYIPEMDCVETTVTDYSVSKTTCTKETMGSSLAIKKCGDTICALKRTYSRKRTSTCASGTYLYNKTYCYSRGTRTTNYTYTIVK